MDGQDSGQTITSAFLTHLFNKNHSHLGPCALPDDLDAKWLGANGDLVNPFVLIGLWSTRDREGHWYLEAFRSRVPDLDMKRALVCLCVRHAGWVLRNKEKPLEHGNM